MQVGYARVSTPDQNLSVQLEALQHNGCTKIFQEVASGTKADRQGLTAALDDLRPGDTLVVWRLDRLGRSLGQLIILMNTLHQQQSGFHSLVEAMDTTTTLGQFFFQITGAFAELERNLTRERTLAGLASARRRGRKGGRRKAIDPRRLRWRSNSTRPERVPCNISALVSALLNAHFIVISQPIGLPQPTRGVASI